MIRRNTPHQGVRWCLIGGRLLLDESLADGIRRQLYETLGPTVRAIVPDDVQPVYIAQYFTMPKKVGSLDPRQHAIGMVFCVPIEGELRAQGEALSFRWFEPSSLPSPHDFGFQQDIVVAECLRRLQSQPA